MFLEYIQIFCGPVSKCTTNKDWKGHICADDGVIKGEHRLPGMLLKGISIPLNHIGGRP